VNLVIPIILSLDCMVTIGNYFMYAGHVKFVPMKYYHDCRNPKVAHGLLLSVLAIHVCQNLVLWSKRVYIIVETSVVPGAVDRHE
jgi:hypothetical protein